jgi:hypothetical protein
LRMQASVSNNLFFSFLLSLLDVFCSLSVASLFFFSW